jgi:hypothetical protein
MDFQRFQQDALQEIENEQKAYMECVDHGKKYIS